MDSILNTVKSFVGLNEDDQSFDNDLLLYINAALKRVFQIGVGTKSKVISGTANTWSEIIGTDLDLEDVKLYVCSKVKMAFDPPSNSAALEALRSTISEIEFSISITVDNPTTGNVLHKNGG